MLQNWNWDVIKDLEEQFNENTYLNAQEKPITIWDRKQS
jgi:hypothetical protein